MDSPLNKSIEFAELPQALRIHTVHGGGNVAVVTFSLARLSALSRAELEVARLAATGISNGAIARLRQRSPRTVANQIAKILVKLRVGCRLDLVTIPELLA